MFQVTVSYIEQDLTMPECIDYLHKKFGSGAIISFAPATHDVDGVVDFMLESIVTDKQAAAYFNNHTELYEQELVKIKEGLLSRVSSRFDRLVQVNEDKL